MHASSLLVGLDLDIMSANHAASTKSYLHHKTRVKTVLGIVQLEEEQQQAEQNLLTNCFDDYRSSRTRLRVYFCIARMGFGMS